MKNTLVILFLSIGLFSNAQVFTSKADVSVILESCATDEIASMADIYCTEDKIEDLALSFMDESCLPEMKQQGVGTEIAITSYAIFLSITSKGKLQQIEVISRNNNSCASELQTKLWKEMKKWNFIPAENAEIKIDYRKYISVDANWAAKRARRAELKEGESESDEVFKVVEYMPRFPGCEDKLLGDIEKQSCASQKMLEYVYGNLVYPDEARKNRTEGRAVIQFVVGKDGYIRDAVTLQDPGAGCGQAALDVMNKMIKEEVQWTPGFQNENAVNVQFTLPVVFKLEGR